ncbi:sugar phosphate isomerase/epimerase (plasmid) [Rhizobium sp. CB3171]|uniref:sugar phosphate isomerase/epimerase family protein n=1 Tax=Rhizobium sp. CB3171 TaxID=3039157 RepID=UPI0024B1EFFC|nr:sugar phosphate isomerase/epimerase family protein [Rhizobium sp. CB3171]WFU06235.1 sugar phosphate isomerase/epimerase [Rhizobium sp. CB3171]
MGAGSLFFGSPIWTFNWNPPYEASLKRLARTGCRGFELTAWSVDMLDYYTPATIRGLKEIAADEGLTLTNFFFNLPFSRQAGAAFSTVDLDGYKRGVDIVAEIGAPIMTSMTPYPFQSDVKPILQRPISQEWTAAVEPQWDWTAEYNAVVDGFAKACEIAGSAGLRVAIEPHPYRWVSSGQGMLRLIERTGASNLGLNFDPSHLFPAGDMPHYVVLALGDRIFNTHFSDNEGHTNAHWRPGRGKIDWKAIFAALQAIGYSGPITLELEDAPGASHWTHFREATPEFDQEMRRGMNYLRDVAAELNITIS